MTSPPIEEFTLRLNEIEARLKAVDYSEFAGIEQLESDLESLRQDLLDNLLQNDVSKWKRQQLLNIRKELDTLTRKFKLFSKNNYKACGNKKDATNYLVHEHDSLIIAINDVDDTVQHAKQISQSLSRQRSMLQRVQGMFMFFTDATRRNNQVLSAIRRINFKRAIVLATVTFVCMFFIIRATFAKF